jgi:hypothetical protein
MIRCLECGCSRLDREGYKCDRCGGAPGLRSERCYISESTKATLLAHAEELKNFGVTLEEHEIIEKSADTILGALGLGLAVADSLRHGTLKGLALFLRDKAIPEDEILRLRLDEPELILKYCRMDKANDEVAPKV